MIYLLYPQLDTTIYEREKTQNSGLDSLLEISHIADVINASTSSCYNSRVILKFNIDDVEDKVNAGLITSASYYLALRTAVVEEIPFEYKIYAYPLSSSWYNGTGRVGNRPTTTDGASWQYRTSKVVGTEWDIPPQIATYEWDEISDTWADADLLFGTNLSIYVTSSYCTNEGGGTWWNYDGLECTQSFSYETSDVYMNVTQIVRKWITGSGRIDNDGMILMFDRATETSNHSLSSLKFYSTDSNTIYVPRLHVIWDDSVFSTGSLTPVDLSNTVIDVKLKKYYSTRERVKIPVLAYKQFPNKSYATSSYFTQRYYLPTSSYYEIRDAHTDEIIVPFNYTGSKLSCDSNGNYFKFWMSSLQPERFYRVVVRVETEGGYSVSQFDGGYTFKVVR